MKEVNAVIGGEGNGGIIYPEFHYGRDALVGIALFLTYLAKSDKKMSELRATYPDYYISKKKLELNKSIDFNKILDKLANKYKNQDILIIDGLKIIFDQGWVHLRQSNTEPIIRIYAESKSKEISEELAEKLISDIKKLL